LECPFIEGDDFHPRRNVEKMSGGTPLTDHDRKAWIAAIASHINQINGDKIILSCSALTQFVQTELTRLCTPEIKWIALELPQAIALKRSESRTHFMPPALVASQYQAWTAPNPSLSIDATQTIEMILVDIQTHFV